MKKYKVINKISKELYLIKKYEKLIVTEEELVELAINYDVENVDIDRNYIGAYAKLYVVSKESKVKKHTIL